MKKYTLILSLASVMVSVFSSCQKSDLVAPAPKTAGPLTVKSFTGQDVNGKVVLHFSVANQNDSLAYFQVFSGSTGNNLCAIARIAPSTSTANTTYEYQDASPKGNPTYYMLVYVLQDGTTRFVPKMLSVQL